MANPGCRGRDCGYGAERAGRMACRVVAVLALGMALSACAGGGHEQMLPAGMFANSSGVPGGSVNPRVIKGPSRLQCVPYARARSKIAIRGNAWRWWRNAHGRYRRGSQPAVGAVLVLKRKGRSRGHVAVVTRILNDREIVVDHANWLNRGHIHKDTRVRDVSARNDWTAIKVWYTPGRQYGTSTYHPYGFIYPLPYERRADARS